MIQCIGAVTGILAARLLGPEGRGDLATIIYYPTVLSSLGSMGIQQAVAFEVSKRPQEEAAILRTGLWISLLLGMSLGTVGIVVIPFLIPWDKVYLVSSVRWFMVLPLLALLTWAFVGDDQGAFRFGRYNAIRSIPAVGYLVGIIAAWWLQSVDAFVFAACAVGGYFAALLIRGTLLSCFPVTTKGSWSEAKNLLKHGLKFHVPQITAILMAQADMFIVISLLSTDKAGLYTVALAVAQGQLALSSAFMQVGFAKVAGEVDRTAARRALLLQFRVAQLATLTATFFLMLMAPYILRYAFGTAFVPAEQTTLWLIGALGVMGLNGMLDNGFRALNHAWAGIAIYLVGLCVLVLGAAWRLPEGGIEAMGQIVLLASFGSLLTGSLLLVKLEDASLSDIWGIRLEVFRFLLSYLSLSLENIYSRLK